MTERVSPRRWRLRELILPPGPANGPWHTFRGLGKPLGCGVLTCFPEGSLRLPEGVRPCSFRNQHVPETTITDPDRLCPCRMEACRSVAEATRR